MHQFINIVGFLWILQGVFTPFHRLREPLVRMSTVVTLEGDITNLSNISRYNGNGETERIPLAHNRFPEFRDAIEISARIIKSRNL